MDTNKDFDDLVFESLMQEMITGQRPPDLSARILAAARQEAASIAQSMAGNAIPPQMKSKVQAKAPVATGALSSGSVRSDNSSQLRIWLAGLAAALLIGVASWQWFVRNNFDSANKNTDRSVDPISRPAIPDLADIPTAKPEIDETKQPTTNRLVPETIESLPFELDSQIAQESNTSTTSTSVEKPAKLSREQIVEQLNRHLAAMWQSLEVTPAATMSPVELAQQISATLTGQTLSDAELTNLNGSEAQALDIVLLINQLSQSEAFHQVLSRQFVQQWTGRPTSGPDNALADSLAERMQVEPKWNDIVRELIGGDLENTDSISNQFLSIFSGGENHRLIECVGREFMNEQIACMRCHRHPDRSVALEKQQASYWSLVALLKGIEGHGPGQPVLDRQAELFAGVGNATEPSVYFELPNGALKQAYPALPDGQSWRITNQPSPRRALAEWLKNSPQLDQATVNTVWQMIFGRPLMPRNASVDAVALEHRKQLLVFLSQQFDLADHDLAQLAGWIVSSQAFSIRANTLTRDQWQSMEQAEIDQWQLADWTFATGARSQSAPSKKRIQANLNYVAKWRRDGKPQPVLSQPSPAPSLLKSPNALKPQRPTFSTSFAVHGLRHTVAEESFVDQLLRSQKLTWQERVQHVFGLSGVGSVNDEIQLAAKELLQHHSGDTRAALLDLLWASQSSQF